MKDSNDINELIVDKTNRILGKKENSCKICGHKGMFDTYLAREMMQNKRDEFEYFECNVCGCLQISSIPDNLGEYYGNDYYSFSLEEDPNYKYSSPVTNHNKILDVGCGSGRWLFQLAQQGYDNLFGCDPFLSKDIHHGNRVSIKKCTIHELTDYGSFDLIRMNDSFEYVSDPLETLQSASRLVKSEGIIVMNIPTYPNIAFEMFGPHWYQLDAPRHLFLHSRKSISILAEKANLKVLDYTYNSNSGQIIRSFFYERSIPYYEITPELINQYFSDQDIVSIEQDSKECNLSYYGDHMSVTLTKNNT